MGPRTKGGIVKQLIVNGDDFGLALPVNEAIEIAHRKGILSSASLMVAGGAADDAIARAHRLPRLRVGLHLVLVEGRPVLPPEQLPDLVDRNGEFSRNLLAAGLRFFFRPGVRRQLEAEIRAQFEAFARSGLALDHVNAHNHMHFHPTLLDLMLRVGRDFGLGAVRVPYEPPGASWRAAGTGLVRRSSFALLLAPLIASMRRRLRAAGIRSNDFVFGIHDAGGLAEDLVLRLIERLPEGVTEIFFHAATEVCPELARDMVDYGHRDELAALTSERVRGALERLGIAPIGYADLGAS